MSLRLATVALLTVSTLHAAPAHAGSVRTAWSEAGQQALFEAAPGERNVLEIAIAGGRIVFRDSGALTTAGFGCNVDVLDGAVSCEIRERRLNVQVGLGDGDDVVTARSDLVNAFYDGGAGADTISGSPGWDHMTGGPGADELRGGPGNDWFFEDSGAAPSLEPDLYDGGDGHDGITYAERPAGIVVDLAAGVAPEGDRLAGVESLWATNRDDVLRGSDADETFFASGGRDHVDARGGDDNVRADNGMGVNGGVAFDAVDTIIGGSGDDLLTAKVGRDRVLAGPGDDYVSAPPAAAVRCHDGLDTRETSSYPGQLLPAPRDCELLSGSFEPLRLYDPRLAAHPRARSGARVALRVGCVPSCRARVELRAPRPGRARARGRLLARSDTLRLRRRLTTIVLPRPSRTRVDVVLRAPDGATAVLAVKLPRRR